jgi:leucyl aminopeptidase
MITAATITTAALRQFSNFFTPVHFASEAFKLALTEAATVWGEGFTFWGRFLPFEAANATRCADLSNAGHLPSDASIGAGSNIAAHFLRSFAERPLTHIDIFNTVWNWSQDYPGAAYGATGAVFNSLFTALSQGRGAKGSS